MEQVAADPVMLADLGPAQAREVRLGLIYVRPVFCLVLDRIGGLCVCKRERSTIGFAYKRTVHRCGRR
jgi:hypothetical protein